jgi:oxygen-independent coproporphyrinogen-3 oxidase
MANPSGNPVTSLYVHVPFCAQKCAYCAFYSEASSGELISRYTAALIRELEIVADDLKPKTIFFGGGTPSLLNLRQWEQILRAMEKLNLLGAEEFTVECNPATVSADKAKLFRDFGINRISMGVQSLDEKLLDRLGRIHSREMVFKSFDILRHAGFENVNLDLMFAIPTQTMEIWRGTLNEAMAMQSEHLSSYEVIYEDDTPLYEQLQAGQFSVDENLACEMYEELISSATRGGFHQYEIANFARNKSKAQSPKSKACEIATTLDIGHWTFLRSPAATTSITGAEVRFTDLGRARPATFAACGRRTGRTRNSIATSWKKAGARLNPPKNCRRCAAPAKSPRSVCG